MQLKRHPITPRIYPLALEGVALGRAVRHFIRHEGMVLHPYLDTKGLVTVGVGFLFTDEEAFVALPFVHRTEHRTENRQDAKK